LGLISKEVEIKLNSRNIKHYEDLNYLIPKIKDKWGRIIIVRGTTIIVKVEDLLDNSNAKVDVKCDCCGKELNNIIWQSYKNNIRENENYYCRKCGYKLFAKEKELKTRLKNGSKSFEQWCLENNYQDILDRWDYELNNCKPSEVCYRSSKNKYYFKCPIGIHKSELKRISDFTIKQGKSLNCDQCISLGYLFPESLNLWSNKNKKTPYEYSYGSSEYVYWKCQNNKHKDYKRSIKVSNNLYFRCPECTKENDESILQTKIRLYLISLGYQLNHENKCSLKCYNPKTKYLLPYDNEVKELKLLIETHGKQHYEICSWHKKLANKKNTTPEYELHMQKVRDRYKRMYAKSKINNYHYLEIPYWTDDNEETWKNLIDNKINEITNIKYIEQQNKSA